MIYNVQKHERWILGIVFTSIVFAIIEFGISLGDGLFGASSYWMAPLFSISTLLLHSVTLPVWKKTAQKRRGTNIPPFIYSITLCVLTCVLAVFWFISMILALVISSSLDLYDSGYYYPDKRYNADKGFAEGAFALLNSLLLWALFGLIFHYRKVFLRNGGDQNPAPVPAPNLTPNLVPPKPLPNVPIPSPPLQPHEKWILGVIITCMVLCIIEFGLSLGDGFFGGHSAFIAIIAAILTEVLHIVTLPVWKKTAKKRQGTTKPSFIYSVTLCVLSCLLAVVWFGTSLTTFILVASTDGSWYYEDVDVSVGYAEAVFALFISGLMWAEFALVVHHRKRFLKRVKNAQINTPGITPIVYPAPVVPPPPHIVDHPEVNQAVPYPQLNPMYNPVSPQGYIPPSFPPTTHGGNPYPPPVNPYAPYAVVEPANPVYRPPPMAQVNPMMQKDEGN
ncbi:hypothetical protein FRC14_007335 [Serendipita sp. 396]|nr:hypothetical protein FRC14_007335 [Serendipita sp. 396]KAG8777698.1 hypothetical protein FRC15_011170 [Serendipita sp. 397]KAG8794457.1 hypothetical protein FRC16_010520 [Serendipita sp. 398]KAG8862845.1 hypothetical protein FRC20_011024 [Serendipita sp. 405]